MFEKDGIIISADTDLSIHYENLLVVVMRPRCELRLSGAHKERGRRQNKVITFSCKNLLFIYAGINIKLENHVQEGSSFFIFLSTTIDPFAWNLHVWD